MALAQPRTFLRRSRGRKAIAFLPSREKGIRPRRISLARRAVKKGGRVVCGGIHMSDIPSFPYDILWEEREILSVANLTRADAREFLSFAPKAGIKTEVTRYPLADANKALADLREGHLQGAAVL